MDGVNYLQDHIQWEIHHIKRNHALNKELMRVIRQRYFPGVAESQNENQIGDYKIIKIKMKEDSTAVNINEESNQPTFRQIKSFEMCVAKYARGNKPTKHSDVHNYTKTHYVHEFSAGREVDQTINLTELATFIVPTNESKSTNNTIQNRNNVTGGDNDDFMNNVRTSYAANRDRIYGSLDKNPNNNSTVYRNTFNADRNTNTMDNLQKNNTNNNKTNYNNHWNKIVSNRNSQTGGVHNDQEYEEKYKKYKEKYLQLKNQKAKNMRI
nr:hypothetical protein [Mimivirus sp.]